MTPAEQREHRARKAKELAERGFTQQQIAKQFGVDQSIISDDLKKFNLWETHKLKHAKTTSNPKGAGRPRGSKNKHTSAPKKHDAHVEIVKAVKEGKSKREAADDIGVSDRTVRRELEYEAIVEVTC